MGRGSIFSAERISVLNNRMNDENEEQGMSTRTLPLTDLALFKEKVLDLVPEASLPRNLSDDWLAK